MCLGRSAWFLGYVVPSSPPAPPPRPFLLDPPPRQSSWGISAFPIPTLPSSGAAEPNHSPKPGYTRGRGGPVGRDLILNREAQCSSGKQRVTGRGDPTWERQDSCIQSTTVFSDGSPCAERCSRGWEDAGGTAQPGPCCRELAFREAGRQSNEQIEMPHFLSSEMPGVVRRPIILCATKKEKGLPSQ